MACGDTTSDCMMTPLGSWSCGEGAAECAACCWPFSAQYDFPETNDPGHLCCWAGIHNEESGCLEEVSGELSGEAREGRWCGYGCSGWPGSKAAGYTSSDDTYLAAMSDDGPVRADDVEEPGGGNRWLEPATEYPSHRDAAGMIHDLRSNEYHPVGQNTIYRRGACWTNGGVECFGIDACRCLGRYRPNTYSGDGFGCGVGVAVNDPIQASDHIPDTQFRAGYGWPPRHQGGCVNNGQLGTYYWCRQYQSCRRADDHVEDVRVQVVPPIIGGLSQIVEGMMAPAFLSSKCVTANALAYLVAETGRDSACGTSQWETSNHQMTYYLDQTQERDKYRELVLVTRTHPWGKPRLAVDPNHPADAEFKNKILAFVDSTREFGDLKFDRLDAVPGNANLSNYRRYYDGGDGGTVMSGDNSPYGACRLTQSKIPLIATLRVLKIIYHALVVPESLTPDYRQASPERTIEPHIEFQIAIQVVTDVEFDLPDPGEEGPPAPPTWMQSWRPADDPKRVRHLTLNRTTDSRGYVLYSVDDQLGNRGVDTIEYLDTDGRQVTPPMLVEWQGHLGGHGEKDRRCTDQRVGIGLAPLAHPDEGLNYWWNALHGRGRSVGGWPTFAETRPDKPMGPYEGYVGVRFGT